MKRAEQASGKILKGIADLVGIPEVILDAGGASTSLPDGRAIRISVVNVWKVEVDGEWCTCIDIRPCDEHKVRWIRVRAVKEPTVIEALAGRIPTMTSVHEGEKVVRISTASGRG